MDFRTASFDELDQHAMELLVFGTGELSPILKGHLFIERVLETLITQNIPNPASLLSKHRLSFEVGLRRGEHFVHDPIACGLGIAASGRDRFEIRHDLAALARQHVGIVN